MWGGFCAYRSPPLPPSPCDASPPDQAALARFRSTSKAPAGFAFLAGLSPLTRAQIAAGFAVSRQGADTIIQGLVAVGLVRRADGVIRAIAPSERDETAARPAPSIPPLTSVAEVDDALAAVDALLARTIPPERPRGS